MYGNELKKLVDRKHFVCEDDPMTTKQINRAIKHLNLEVIHNRGSGYSYFLDLTTGDQVGDSVYVCHLNQQTLDKWVHDAQWARNIAGSIYANV